MLQKTHLLTFVILCGLNSALLAQTLGIGGTIPVEISVVNRQDFAKNSLPKSPLISIPMYRDLHWMIEPEFGVIHFRGNLDLTEFGPGKSVNSLYVFNCYLRYNLGDSTLRHGPGIRIGISYFERKRLRDNESTEIFEIERDRILGVTYFGEYFLGSAFSIGGEAQLSYTILGFRPIDEPAEDVRLTQLSMRFTLRWYFLE